jgi:flagellar basal body rod protein FlgG
MFRGMFSAATGMGAQQLRLDIIANNLANVNTTGFKKSRGDFEDLVYQTIRQAGGGAPRRRPDAHRPAGGPGGQAGGHL